jgi:glycosyltransferase involved in cell wall biosynthesis
VKILHLLGWYFPDSVGGTEVYVEALCRRLRAAGHDVRIAAPDSHGAAPDTYEHEGVPVLRYAISDQPTRDEAYHRVVVRGGERLHRWLADERPDILHIHSFTTGVGLPEIRAARRLGIRVIVTCHLPGFGYMCRTGELMQWGRVPCDGVVELDKCASCNLTRLGLRQSLARFAGAVPLEISAQMRRLPGRVGTTLGMVASVDEYRRMQRELFDLVEHFVVLNETARQMLLANGSPAAKLSLNRLGLSQSLSARKESPDAAPTRRPVRFGFVGRIHPSKGLTELVRAAVSLPNDSEFSLEIRGPAADAFTRRYAEELRAEAAGDSRVTFAGPLSSDEIPDVLARFDALVVPSMWFENGPTIALESMAVGTPIVASRVGNLPEIVEDGVSGRLVAPGDVRALAAVLASIVDDPAGSIDVWRRHLPTPRTMDDVTVDYLSMYAA